MDETLFKAILLMDSYNCGYDAGRPCVDAGSVRAS